MPNVARAPPRKSSPDIRLPYKIDVLGCPSTPACNCGVPGELVVISGGSVVPLPHHIKNSALPHTSRCLRQSPQQPQQPSSHEMSSAGFIRAELSTPKSDFREPSCQA